LSENLYPSIPPDIQIRLDWFEMKNPTYALVTGASQGLGRVFARELAGRKQNVILVARSGVKLKSLATKILYMNAKSFRCNTYEKTGVTRPSNLGADLLKLLYQLAYLLFKLFVLDAAIGKSRAQSGVKLECSCSPNNFGDIRAADSRAGDNDDPFQSSFDKFGEHGGSLQRTFRAAGRQDSFRASLDHIFERLVKITCLVECSVIRHRQWLCKFNEFPCALNVDAMVFRQDAQNEAIHSGFFGVRDRAPHL